MLDHAVSVLEPRQHLGRSEQDLAHRGHTGDGKEVLRQRSAHRAGRPCADGSDAGHDAAMALPRDVVVVLLDSLNRHMLGALRRHRVRHAEPRPVRGALGALHAPLHRLAAVHARPPRHARRRARLPVAAVGIDRDLGGGDHRACSARRRRVDDARDRPSAPVRDRRRELPHRLHGVGLRARPRGRSVAHAARPVVRSARRRCPPGAGDGLGAATTSAARGSATRPTSPGRGRWRPRPSGSTASERGAPSRRAGLLFVDEFDPHEPFDTPEPWATRYDADWEGERIIWPPYTAATATHRRHRAVLERARGHGRSAPSTAPSSR